MLHLYVSWEPPADKSSMHSFVPCLRVASAESPCFKDRHAVLLNGKRNARSAAARVVPPSTRIRAALCGCTVSNCDLGRDLLCMYLTLRVLHAYICDIQLHFAPMLCRQPATLSREQPA